MNALFHPEEEDQWNERFNCFLKHFNLKSGIEKKIIPNKIDDNLCNIIKNKKGRKINVDNNRNNVCDISFVGNNENISIKRIQKSTFIDDSSESKKKLFYGNHILNEQFKKYKRDFDYDNYRLNNKNNGSYK